MPAANAPNIIRRMPNGFFGRTTDDTPPVRITNAAAAVRRKHTDTATEPSPSAPPSMYTARPTGTAAQPTNIPTVSNRRFWFDSVIFFAPFSFIIIKSPPVVKRRRRSVFRLEHGRQYQNAQKSQKTLCNII